LIRGPGIKPGSCSHVRASGADLFPTFAELAHVTSPWPQGIEGGSLVPVLTNGGNGTVKRPREEFVVHFPHYDKDPLGPASTVLLGDYKLIRVYETGQRRLFDVAKDPGERLDLAEAMPDKVKDLDARLTDYLQSVQAQVPTRNPNFDPSKAVETTPLRKQKRDAKGDRGRKGRAP
jgi:arylsulfatase A-like enzyme